MSMTKFRIILLSFLFILLLLPTHITLADTGPKPTMDFEFKGLQDGELQIVSGVLYECDQPDCSDASPLKELGPQGLRCDTTSCTATAYGFAPYHVLEIEFSDEITRRSNVFETAGFASKYTVTVQLDDLLVKAQLSLGAVPPNLLFFAGLACTCTGMALVLGLIIFVIIRFVKKSD
jgi:hypothetical protein